MENLDKLIEEKTKQLNKMVRQIQELRQQLNQLTTQSLKLDGEITGLKKARDLQEK